MRQHKKMPPCAFCSQPVNVEFAMSDPSGRKAHIYCYLKDRGLELLVKERNAKRAIQATKVRGNAPRKAVLSSSDRNKVRQGDPVY